MPNLLRTLFFLLFMVLWFLPFTGFVALTSWMSLSERYAFVTRWNRRVTTRAFEWILGVRYRVEGMENLPQTPAVILAKHSSAWETLALANFLPPIAYVLKRELLRIPFFGWGLARMPMISINRRAGKDALRQVVEQGRALLAQGFWVIIFPEGTRTAIGTQARYKAGGASLAVAAGVPVVPLVHNAGEFWPRHAFVICPGEIVVSIGPAIETAGRTPDEVTAATEAWMEAEMRRLFPHHYNSSTAGARPVPEARS
ncbi:MAG: 1-acyl-sn-glycerol-3-phosphate acyltransferase [Candidatus Dactylopiibacterium carminicum]|uniref:1-acyl-sn-glycerol-3-phosphate acyltransferase n=1 Tax=Candidatus Dactylopiibacterium carminicum TaxID=857335 RepID=A0A272ERJ3_9RHOO|nr:lysophospholipid acyltransferase family protein [Candidatus Dactylopiibacterium carminicum]KAF7598815.1 1-acyl-sn-glycerol-3-phosphate acyltransferase [Candidatus Dactylopiibacterium carminicum]PAS92729.1 MAG: 1-acyl-sn-glycerol-3-phosphate acyltransferase [Candidatus Dactylopiibacterium carminicum]PAS98838.1 MAG: 1-acyl-sn-glycerol-3-phosphate acyltransferase [Candidatus Dactylopiibacterium carminicum]